MLLLQLRLEIVVLGDEVFQLLLTTEGTLTDLGGVALHAVLGGLNGFQLVGLHSLLSLLQLLLHRLYPNLQLEYRSLELFFRDQGTN